MIAEIYNKISSSGSNLTDRLEDKLTGDFFGALRYLPYECGLKPILEAVRFHNEADRAEWLRTLDGLEAYAVDYVFWPNHDEGEIDLLLKHTDAYIGVEVKYRSSLSSVDEDTGELAPSITPENSKNQLARYARMLADVAGTRDKYLVFLAPYDILFPVEAGIRENPVIVSSVKVGFLGWQDAQAALFRIDRSILPHWQTLIITDLIDLLQKKRLTRYAGLPESLIHTELSNDVYRFTMSKAYGGAGYSWAVNQVIGDDVYVYGRTE